MKPYIPQEYQEEEKRLQELMLSMDEDFTIEEFIEQYASTEYKTYLRQTKEETDKLWEQGIIVN